MQPKKLSFPEDHKQHDATIEWWYYNGHLQDAEGNKYSFMDCLFRADIERAKIPYLSNLPLGKVFGKGRHAYSAHSILTNIALNRNHKELQHASIVSNDSFVGERLFVDYIDPIIMHGFVNNIIEETGDDIFHIKTSYVDLKLESRKPMLLENGNGFVTVCGRGSYYYSLTDMETSGSILFEGKRIEVTGRSWMDHQWSDATVKLDKWSWFSLQLDDGTDIMCCEYDNGKTVDYLVDIISKSGKSHHFKSLIVKRGSEVWKSEKTSAVYPMTWDIEIPEFDAKFKVTSQVTDHEMIFMAINYWEGPIEVEGMIGGKEVAGTGFMELVGYPADYHYLLSFGKEVGKKLLSGSNE